MRLLPCILVSLAACAVSAQGPVAARRDPAFPSPEELRKQQAIWSRALELRPRRRDTPLRELNISDGEVREIEAIARRELLLSMLNISPVTAGCSCEEGPLCTDQVFVVATTADQTTGLQLSRVRSAWVVGPVQQWWRRYDALDARAARMGFREYFEARGALLQEFPMCVTDDPVPDQKAAQTK